MKIGCIDIETTGFSRTDDDIVEIAIVEWDSEEHVTLEERVVLCKARKPMPKRALEVHGITDEMLDAEGHPWERVAPKLHRRLMELDAYLGHNINSFDMPFIARQLERVGLTLPERPQIDTLKLARQLIPTEKSKHKALSHVASYFEVEDSGVHHRALADVHRNILVFEAMLRKWPHLTIESIISGRISSRGDHMNTDLFSAYMDGQPDMIGGPGKTDYFEE